MAPLVVGGYVGGTGGTEFSCYGPGADGRVMQRIKVWAATSRIKAISVWLTDGVENTFGDPSKPAGEGDLHTAEFSFNTGERVTSLSLWGNGAGTRSGWIYFHTSEGRTFDFGMYSWGKQTEYKQSVASGIWVGITGRASSDVDALGVVFLQPIQSCQLINVEYPTLQFSGSSGGTTTITASSTTKSFSVLNTAPEEKSVTWEVADQPLIDNVSHSWSLSNASAGLLQFVTTSSISVQARTPALAVVDNDVGWNLSDSDTQSSSLSSSSSLTLPWSRTGSLSPSQSFTLSAGFYRGDVTNLPFNGSVRVTCTTSDIFSFMGPQGQFTGQSYAPAITASQ